MANTDNKKTSSHTLFHEIMKKYNSISYLKPEDIPDIPLYMDQVTSLMDSKLEDCKRYPEDKILTKTMINNYTKNKMIPPPDKKKYSKEHLIFLLYVYYLKDFLSIDDIAKVLRPLEKSHFLEEDDLSMTEIYERVIDLERSQMDYMTHDLFRKYQAAKEVYSDTSGEDREYMDAFALISLLSFDVYIKKQLIEHLIDLIPEEEDPKKKKKRK